MQLTAQQMKVRQVLTVGAEDNLLDEQTREGSGVAGVRVCSCCTQLGRVHPRHVRQCQPCSSVQAAATTQQHSATHSLQLTAAGNRMFNIHANVLTPCRQ